MRMHREITRKPTTPGEILHEEFLEPLGMSQKELADHLECDVKVVNRIVNGRTSVTAEMVLKLGASFRAAGLNPNRFKLKDWKLLSFRGPLKQFRFVSA